MEYINLKESFFFRVAPDKFSMGFDKNNCHYSMSFGMKSKILDFHQTIEGKEVNNRLASN